MTSGGYSGLGFDYVRLQQNETILWQFGLEDFSHKEFFPAATAYPIGDNVVSNTAERVVDVTVEQKLVQQPTALFPRGIHGPSYSGTRTIRVHFYVPD